LVIPASAPRSVNCSATYSGTKQPSHQLEIKHCLSATGTTDPLFAPFKSGMVVFQAADRHNRCFSRKGPDLEAFSHNPTDDGIAPGRSTRSRHQMSEPTVPLVLSGIAAATIQFISRVKLTCLTTV